MTAPFSGGCYCGAVRYECSSEPVHSVHCFCEHCQKFTGTQMSTNIAVPKSSVRVTKGQPAEFTTTGDSGKKVKRSFCAKCGSPLFSEPELLEGTLIIKVGSLDDSSWVQPAASIYVESAASWSTLPEGIPRFPKLPPPN